MSVSNPTDAAATPQLRHAAAPEPGGFGFFSIPEQAVVFSPPGDLLEPIAEPVEGARLHFARLRVFQQVPLVLRQFSRELCWELICTAVVRPELDIVK